MPLNALASVQLEHLPVDPHLLRWIFSALEASEMEIQGRESRDRWNVGNFAATAVFCPRPIMQSVQARCLKKLFPSYFLRITLKDWEYRGAVQVIGQFPILAGSAPGGWGAEAGDFLRLSLGHWTLPSIALSTHELFFVRSDTPAMLPLPQGQLPNLRLIFSIT